MPIRGLRKQRRLEHFSELGMKGSLGVGCAPRTGALPFAQQRVRVAELFSSCDTGHARRCIETRGAFISCPHYTILSPFSVQGSTWSGSRHRGWEQRRSRTGRPRYMGADDVARARLHQPTLTPLLMNAAFFPHMPVGVPWLSLPSGRHSPLT